MIGLVSKTGIISVLILVHLLSSRSQATEHPCPMAKDFLLWCNKYKDLSSSDESLSSI